jgi:chromosome partitioning protein
MFQHTNLSKQVLDDVRTHLGDKVYKTVIPRNVTVSEAPSYGQPVVTYDAKSLGAVAYQELAKEVAARG